ncbi:MAG: tryptophan synthase subunit alpha [Nitrosomonadales bacterium]|jgi:tryptophan synthase alpha chain
MNRIVNTFENLKNNNKKALIPFVTAGDPSPELTIEIMHEMVKNGADLIELGIPFSDPMADGPVIQRSSERAIENGIGIKKTIEIAKKFRKNNKETPIILMGYANPIEAIGVDNFIDLASDADVDGVITVDYTPEESVTFSKKLKEKNIETIYLIAPTTDENRIKLVLKLASGFLYYVSLKGVTGASNIDIKEVEGKINTIKKYTQLPIAVGFGVRNEETAKQVATIADGVVIGSRVVNEIEDSEPGKLIGNIANLIKIIKKAL